MSRNPVTRCSNRIGSRYARRNRHAVDTVDALALLERLSALETAVAELTQTQAGGYTALGEAVERLDKQLARVGREQYKTNTLYETQQKAVEATLEPLRESIARHEQERTQWRERAAQADEQGRLEVIRRLFPVLDGLEEALNAGQRLLTTLKAAPAPPSFWERLNPARRAAPADAGAAEAISAWLEGLTFVRERALATLATDKVVPIRTEGCAFDPHLHVAVEAIPATNGFAPGIIVREQRRGYLRGDAVLRYAEVVVARANGKEGLESI
jgi:molecular chaperone GrpE (heat shock protein)